MIKRDVICGIYKIENKASGKVYVGSSKNIKRRWYDHLRMLRSGSHHSQKLQRSWNKHGESQFVFSVVTEVEESSLALVEQEFIEKYEAWKNGYNVAQIVEGRMRLPSKPKGLPKTGGRVATDKTGQPVARVQLTKDDRAYVIWVGDGNFTRGIEFLIEFQRSIANAK